MNSIPKLIGLIGRKGSGKDTIAPVLTERGYQNVKFAGALKSMLESLLIYQGAEEELIAAMVEGGMKELPSDYLGDASPRFAMQTLGTEWGRDIMGEDFWVQRAMRRAGNHTHVVFTDVRFPNEMEAIWAEGGVCFGITADWIVPKAGEHASEAKIDELIAALPDKFRLLNRWADEDHRDLAIQQLRDEFLLRIMAL